MKHVLYCGRLFDARSDDVYEHAFIVTEDERIVAAGSCEAVVRQLGLERDDLGSPQSFASLIGATFEDLSQCFVTPGLIDAHVHIVMDSSRVTGEMFQHGGFGEMTVRAIRNAQADLQAGFTTLRDEGCFAYLDVDVRDMIERGEVWGPRLRVAGLALSSTGGHADIVSRPGVGTIAFPESHIAYIVDGADATRRAARAVIKHGADHVKIMATGGVLSDDAHPGAQDLLFDEMRAACEIARAHEKPVSAHAHGPRGIKDALRAGARSIEHGTLIDREGCELLCEKGAFLVPTIIAHHSILEHDGRILVPPVQIEKARLVMEGVERGLSYLRSIGGFIGFGTDAGITGNRHGRQAREFALMVKHGGMSPREALLAATRVNARLLGCEDELGAIAPGMVADIVAFNGDPLQDTAAFEHCEFVMKAGCVFRRKGAPTVGNEL